MKKLLISARSGWLVCICLMVMLQNVSAQTETDAIMMNKNQICIGPTYTYSSWDHYWEGKLKRENLNLGTVSSQSVMLGANYGITNDLNVMVMAPWVKTKASAGTLHGLEGVQDISLFVKYKALKESLWNGKASIIVVGGVSTPLSDYVVDFLPLSIGLGTTNVSGRVILDYVHKSRVFATGSAAYIWRSNVKLDRTSYYTTEQVISNEVKMPDAMSFNFRAGYRGRYLIAEAQIMNMTTLGGFDITRNNMPFPSNRMNSTAVGADFKYTMKWHTNLALIGGASYVIQGRNVGQAMTYTGGIFYAFYLNKKDRPKS